jgi:hypothetical protein
MLGGFLALLSAASFALNVTALRRGVLTASVFQAIAITVPMGVPLFLVILLLFDCWAVLLNLSTNSIIYFSIAGILHFVFGRYSNRSNNPISLIRIYFLCFFCS